MSQESKNIISIIVYIIGFVMYVIFLTLNNHISTEAWLNTIGACFGTLLFCLSSRIRD